MCKQLGEAFYVVVVVVCITLIFSNGGKCFMALGVYEEEMDDVAGDGTRPSRHGGATGGGGVGTGGCWVDIAAWETAFSV